MLKTLVKIILVLIILINFLPISTQAEGLDYELLEDSVIKNPADARYFETYARAMFSTTLVVIVVLSILMFTWGGFEYIAGNIPGSKTDGKQRIGAAVLGLLIALISWLILNTINPDLINFRLDSISHINTGGAPGSTGTTNNHIDSVLADRLETEPAHTHNNTVDTADCPGCVSLTDRGASVANYSGITGPGRTDLVRPEVADSIINVQETAQGEGIETQITAAYTDGVGHSAGSQHYQGTAVDIQPVGRDNTPANMERLADLCRANGFTYVLNEGNHVHCDQR